MSELKVSIVIPAKNTAEFLPECLESILSQSYSNWEALVVDDHSADNSVQIVSDLKFTTPQSLLLVYSPKLKSVYLHEN